MDRDLLLAKNCANRKEVKRRQKKVEKISRFAAETSKTLRNFGKDLKGILTSYDETETEPEQLPVQKLRRTLMRMTTKKSKLYLQNYSDDDSDFANPLPRKKRQVPEENQPKKRKDAN